MKNKSKRIYVDTEFAKELKFMSIEKGIPVINLTKRIIEERKKKKNEYEYWFGKF